MRGRPAHQPGSSFRPNTALASCCFPRLQAEATGRGAHPLRPEGSPFGAGWCHRVSDCCWRGSDSVCVIRLQKDLPRGTLSQHSTPSTLQNAKHPAGLCLGWLGRRFPKAANSTAGSAGTGGELQQVPSTTPANPQLPRGHFVQFQIPFLSSGMNSLPKAHRICREKASLFFYFFFLTTSAGPVRAAGQPFGAMGWGKNTSSLAGQRCDTRGRALIQHPPSSSA